MITLIFTVLFGLIIAYFAAQNTSIISLNFMQYRLPGLPLYIVIVVAFLLGSLLSWIISLVNSIAVGFNLRGKETKIKDFGKENVELLKLNHQLELENTRLMAETDSPVDNKSL